MEPDARLGELQIKKLVSHVDDPVFNEWEKGFIRDLQGTHYAALPKNQRVIITRLIGWLEGYDDG